MRTREREAGDDNVQGLIKPIKAIREEDKRLQVSEEVEEDDELLDEEDKNAWDDDDEYDRQLEERQQKALEDRQAEQDQAVGDEDEDDGDYDDEEEYEDTEDAEETPIHQNLKEQTLKVRYKDPEELANYKFAKPLMVNRRGVQISIDNLKQLWDFAGKGVDYGLRMQSLAKYRELVTAADKLGLTAADLQGNFSKYKEDPIAFAEEYIKAHKIDVNDLNVFEHDVESVDDIRETASTQRASDANDIVLNADSAAFTRQLYMEEGKDFVDTLADCFSVIPEDAQRLLAGNTAAYKGFASDVSTGLFQKIMGRIVEVVESDDNLANMSQTQEGFFQLYGMVAQEMSPQQPVQQQSKRRAEAQPARREQRVDPKVTQRQELKEHLESLSTRPNNARKEVLTDMWEDDDAFEAEYLKRSGG